MSNRVRFLIRIAILMCSALIGFQFTALAPAGAATAFLSGQVTDAGKPIAGATVNVRGNSVEYTTRTDRLGDFSFATLLPGTYVLSASGAAGFAQTSVDLGQGGATVTLALAPKQIGFVSASRTQTARGSGTDLTLNQAMLTRTPAGGSLPELLLQTPGAARGANGVVHINGDHGDINYIVDGVSIPQELNRNIGTEFDPNDISFVDVLQGAYSAQYGERFASVVNISTRTGAAAAPGFIGEAQGGSYAHFDQRLSYHGPLAGGSLVVAVRNERSDRGLDPPNFASPHNAFSNANQFVRFTLPRGNDYLNFTLSHAYHAYQIPSDVENGEAASTDDNELQDDLFAALQFRHSIGDHGSLSFGPAFKRSRIRDLSDPANDFAYGEALNIAAGGTATDCANAVTSGNFNNATCAYSLFGDRTAKDYRFNVDYALRSRAHEVRAGAVYDAANVTKTYSVTLQPGNFLAPLYTPLTPAIATKVTDSAPNVGHTEEAYLQDTWKMGANYVLDYGIRLDSFQVHSSEFVNGTGMTSPRVKLTRVFSPRSSLYAFYGRFFTPFSLENVSPTAAAQLNLPKQPTVAAFDLKPQRDSVYEIGGHLAFGVGDLGFRAMQKNAADLIDDTQVGVTLLHQDINYQLGRIATQSAYYQLPLARSGRFYASVSHTYSVNKGCETQLLAPCFGSPTEWTPADHEQRWGITSGALINDRHNGWLAIDSEYGSGLSSAICQPGTPGFCKRTPHVTFDTEKGIGLGRDSALTLRVRNLLNDRYFVTLLNAQGNHYAAPRTFDLGIKFGAP